MLTTKRSLLFLSLTVILSLLFAACGGSQPSETSNSNNTGEQPAAATNSSKSITIVIPEDPPSFNPMVADTGYDALVLELVLLGLTDIDPYGIIFPELATELPTINNKGVVVDEDAGTMSVTWKMREDAQW